MLTLLNNLDKASQQPINNATTITHRNEDNRYLFRVSNPGLHIINIVPLKLYGVI